MSSFNSRADVGHGVGGGNASINNVAFSKGGWAGWLSDDEGFFANGADGWACSVYSQSAKQIRRAVADPANGQFGAGMNSGFVGGGVWAAQLDDASERNPQRGLFSSSGLHFPDAGLMAVGPVGELAFKPSYQSFGPVMVLDGAGQAQVAGYSAPGAAPGSPEALAALEPDLRAQGNYWHLSALAGGDLQLLGGGRAIWQYGQRIQVAGLPQPLQLGRAYGPRAHFIGGRWWVSYYSTVGGIILHPFDELVGYTIVPPGVDCWHSARSFGPAVRFALFASEAEQDGWLREAAVDTELDRRAPLAPAPAPIVLPPPSRKYFAGWFEFAAAPQGPGNAVLAVRNISGALARPVIVTNETEHLISGEVLGRLIGGASVEDIEAAAKASAQRPVAYWDANAWPRWPALPRGSWLCLRLYCPKGLGATAFYESGRAAIASAPKSVPLVLVGQQYSSNAELAGYVDPSTPPPHDSEALKPLAQALVELANESPSVVALMLFSGYGRAGGLMHHPDLLEPWTNWARQLQAPALEPWPPPAPPDPPKPSAYVKHKEYRMSQKQIVAIVGPAGKYGRPDKPNTGPWGSLKDDAGKPRGWRGLVFDRETPDDFQDKNGATISCKFELSQPDARHQLYHAATDSFFGADATAFATTPGSDQFYLKPAAETRCGYESPVIYEGNVTPGLLAGFVEYVDEKSRKFVSCGFAVEVIS